jgi:hypothetical protein
MQFPTLFAALVLATSVYAAAPRAAPRRDGSLDTRGISCSLGSFGAGLCVIHCVADHEGVKGCTGKCSSKSVHPIFHAEHTLTKACRGVCTCHGC